MVGEADAMHSILDVETEETMAALDGWFQARGGRRGRAQLRTATGGLTYATTRHATSRATTGRTVTLTGSAIDAEHLDHAYALTVHRSQGASYDRAHILAAGGGRELAYVALSRAWYDTTIHATADDLAQAVDDLQADWGGERHQRWITQTAAEVGRHPEPSRAPDPPPTRGDLATRLETLEDDYRDLRKGTGRWGRDLGIGL